MGGIEAALARAQAEGGAPNLRRAIAFAAVDGPLELQALGVRDRPGSQYDATKAAHALTADDAVQLAAEAERWTAQGVYLLPAKLRTGAETRHSSPGTWYTIPKRGGTADSDVEARQILAVDLDVERPTNTSATDAEMALSVAVAERAIAYLVPIVGADSLAYLHSGNGRQVWLALAGLPVTPEVKSLLSALLTGLAAILNTEAVHVDLTLVDAKRILPAAGTTKKKGARGIPERPHRRTAIVTPEHVKRLTEDDLRRLLARVRQDTTDEGRAAVDKALGVRPKPAQAPSRVNGVAGPDLKATFDRANDLEPASVAEWLGVKSGDEVTCPGCGEVGRTPGDSVALLDHGFKCSHNRCQDKGRNGFRTAVDLTMEVRGLDKFEAVNALAERFGFDPLPPKREKLNGVNGPALPLPPESTDALPEDPGYDTQAPDVDEAPQGGGIKGELAAEAPRERPWPELEPFGAIKLPPFPAEHLSPCLRDWALATAEARQVPVDMPGLLGLAAFSLAASRGLDLQVTPSWRESCNLWVVYGAAPGERKSPVFHAATAPIFLYQEQEAAKSKAAFAAYESDKRVLEKQIANAEAAAANGRQSGGCNARDQIHELQSELAALEAPRASGLIADDATPEAAAILLASNGERLGLFSAEGGPFVMFAGKYSDRSDLSLWLKLHSGDTTAVHRVKRGPITLRRPLVTLAVTCQPEVIHGLASHEGFRGQGLLARLLFSLPRSIMGSRKTRTPKVPDLVRQEYNAALVSLLTNLGPARDLALSPDADAAREAMDATVEPRLGEEGDLYPIADWASKLVGLVARFAAVLHAADHWTDPRAMPLEVPLATWLRAEHLGAYALAHARSAFDNMGILEEDATALRLWRWIGRTQAGGFSARDARRVLHCSADEVASPVARLVRRGIVRRGVDRVPEGGGTPTVWYEVNPATFQS